MWYSSGDGSPQTCLQRNPKNGRDPFTDGAGTFRNTGKKELDYNVLLDMYKGTVFDEIILGVNGVRARIMTKKMHTTYSVHQDKTPRYHLALITNPNAYFIFPTLSFLQPLSLSLSYFISISLYHDNLSWPSIVELLFS